MEKFDFICDCCHKEIEVGRDVAVLLIRKREERDLPISFRCDLSKEKEGSVGYYHTSCLEENINVILEDEDGI